MDQVRPPVTVPVHPASPLMRVLPALALVGLVTWLGPAVEAAVVPATIRFERCDEVFAFVRVPEENVRAHVPDDITPSVIAGGVDVQLRTARCDTTIDGVTTAGLSSEIGISIEPPDGKHEAPIHLIRYQLAWTTDDHRYASWVKRATDLGGVVSPSKDLARRSDPGPTGLDPFFSFDSPAPTDWAFRFDASAQWPLDQADTGITVDIYRRTSEGLVRFRAESRRPGDRIGPAEITVSVPATTSLARLLAGGQGCSADARQTRCDAVALAYGYAVEIEKQTFKKEVFR